MVVVDGEVSSWKSVLSDIPQGSVLGPIYFWYTWYINVGMLRVTFIIPAREFGN